MKFAFAVAVMLGLSALAQTQTPIVEPVTVRLIAAAVVDSSRGGVSGGVGLMGDFANYKSDYNNYGGQNGAANPCSPGIGLQTPDASFGDSLGRGAGTIGNDQVGGGANMWFGGGDQPYVPPTGGGRDD